MSTAAGREYLYSAQPERRKSTQNTETLKITNEYCIICGQWKSTNATTTVTEEKNKTTNETDVVKAIAPHQHHGEHL